MACVDSACREQAVQQPAQGREVACRGRELAYRPIPTVLQPGHSPRVQEAALAAAAVAAASASARHHRGWAGAALTSLRLTRGVVLPVLGLGLMSVHSGSSMGVPESAVGLARKCAPD